MTHFYFQSVRDDEGQVAGWGVFEVDREGRESQVAVFRDFSMASQLIDVLLDTPHLSPVPMQRSHLLH
jgi:hypothetical protein